MLQSTCLPLASMAPNIQLALQAPVDHGATSLRCSDQTCVSHKISPRGSPRVTGSSAKGSPCLTTRSIRSLSTCSPQGSPYMSYCSSEVGLDDGTESVFTGTSPRHSPRALQSGGSLASTAVPGESQGSYSSREESFAFGRSREDNSRNRVALTLRNARELMRDQITIVDQLLQRSSMESDAAGKRASVLQREQEFARQELHRMATLARDLLKDSEANLPLLREARDRVASCIRCGCVAGLAKEEMADIARCRRGIQSAIDDRRGKVRICCRIRPMFDGESGQPCVRAVDDITLEMDGGESFTFNSVFSPGTQEEVFEDTKDLVHAAIDGRNVTILSYGPTGSGKTHTLFGSPDSQLDGIAFRAGVELFEGVAGQRQHADVSVSVSMLQLYNNCFEDMLASAGQAKNKLDFARQSDDSRGVSVEGVVEETVRDSSEFRETLQRGLVQRVVAANALNACSSRSHLIVTITVEFRDLETGRTTKSKIRICDLAGSERLKKTKPDGEQQTEAIEINKSLTALGDVMEAVVAGRKVVPYRNHKLARLLQDSLGGTARTLMVVTCSPEAARANETLTALKYASRAGKMTNSVSTKA